MEVSGCSAAGGNTSMSQSVGSKQDAAAFHAMMDQNPNLGYAAQQNAQPPLKFEQLLSELNGSMELLKQSRKEARDSGPCGLNMDAGTMGMIKKRKGISDGGVSLQDSISAMSGPSSMGHMAGMHGGLDMNGELPKQHSGTDHLMHSGLMMRGDATQDFNLNDADGDYKLSSFISGNRHVVEDVTQRVMDDNKDLANKAANGDMKAMDKLEGKIAKELTNVNDIEDIKDKELRRAFVQEGEALGMSRKEMDHLLHTPLSETGAGGMIDKNSEISGALHTVDLKRTRATDMGNGTYEVHLVSNNGKNNAHDNMDISTFYTQADSAKEAENLVNDAVRRGDLDKDGRYNLSDAGMNIMMSHLASYA